MRGAREKLSDTSSRGAQRASLQTHEEVAAHSLRDLQQTAGNQAMLRLLGAGTLQTKPKVSQPTDGPEQEADLIATRIVGDTSGPLMQRKCPACAVGAPCSECAAEETLQPQLKSRVVTGGGAIVQRSPAAGAEATPAANAGAQAKASPAPPSAAPALIVEDDAQKVGPGQMRKSEFLSQLRSALCSAADDALSGTMWSAMGCPYIERWLDHYSKQPGPYVERALRKYAPETATARSAAEYIPIVTERVRRGISEWTSTGEVKDLPPEFAAGGMPGATVGGLVGGALSGIGSAVSGAVGAIGGALSSVGSMLFKRHDGEAGVESGDPQLIQSQLRSGQALDSSVRGRMQSAFGVNFNGVRVHTDTRARELSEGLNARAFTIGSDIAFGPGEYQPGTPVGDALIAHELAHVVQQSGGGNGSSPQSKGDQAHDALEDEADVSAVGAVLSAWGGARGKLEDLGRNAMPRVRSGLRLQRCSKSPHEKEVERLGNLQYGFMEEKRKAEVARLKKEAEEDAKKKGLPPPVTEPKVDIGDIVKKDQEKHALKGSPTTEWDTADQPAWFKRADAAWAAVVASVKGTELESVAKGVEFKFKPKEAFEGGFYAQQSGHELRVGMSWVRFAEQDPKNVWENLAHEMAGHFEYGETYASEIMDSALSRLSDADRKRVIGDPQKFFEAYEYPETEIYASLWQRRYRVPVAGPERPSGGIHPDKNIVKRLNVMLEVLHPEVAKAVLKELKRRVDANPQILQRDKDFFVAKVKEVFTTYDPFGP
jgi:uncharacterized protein DUF4157